MTFIQFINLRYLVISWNPFTHFLPTKETQDNLLFLGLQGLIIEKFDPLLLNSFQKITMVDISYGSIKEIGSFSGCKNLQMIDMKGNEIERFPSEIYKGLEGLKKVISSSFKLCCGQLLPSNMLPHNCIAPQDEVSSCDNLLRSDAYRVFLWCFAFITISGKSV